MNAHRDVTIKIPLPVSISRNQRLYSTFENMSDTAYDHSCVKSDVCDMPVCDGVNKCKDALESDALKSIKEKSLDPTDQNFSKILEKKLKDMGIDFDNPQLNNVLPLDPNKFYVLYINSVMNIEESQKLSRNFVKGGLLVLSKGDSAKEYSLDDLKSMREGLDKFIQQLELKNKTTYNRFDIIRNGA